MTDPYRTTAPVVYDATDEEVAFWDACVLSVCNDIGAWGVGSEKAVVVADSLLKTRRAHFGRRPAASLC